MFEFGDAAGGMHIFPASQQTWATVEDLFGEGGRFFVVAQLRVPYPSSDRHGGRK